MESILATVIWSKIPSDKRNSVDEINFELSEDSIIEEATDLCNLLKYDFILCPVRFSFSLVFFYLHLNLIYLFDCNLFSLNFLFPVAPYHLQF